MMGVFDDLVLLGQRIARTSAETIRPELATGWRWSEDRTRLTFTLREGVRWHDGQAFPAADVKCTWDRVAALSQDRLRINPREGWFRNLAGIDVLSDHAVVFRLKRPQPSFLAFLASGYSPVYPCHVPAAQMRVIRSAPGRIVSSNTGAMKASGWSATPTTGSQVCPIWTGSSTPSCLTARQRRFHSRPGSST